MLSCAARNSPALLIPPANSPAMWWRGASDCAVLRGQSLAAAKAVRVDATLKVGGWQQVFANCHGLYACSLQPG
eukprot:10296332-Alexandrium_andersonii.AAC.1